MEIESVPLQSIRKAGGIEKRRRAEEEVCKGRRWVGGWMVGLPLSFSSSSYVQTTLFFLLSIELQTRRDNKDDFRLLHSITIHNQHVFSASLKFNTTVKLCPRLDGVSQLLASQPNGRSTQRLHFHLPLEQNLRQWPKGMERMRKSDKTRRTKCNYDTTEPQ